MPDKLAKREPILRDIRGLPNNYDQDAYAREGDTVTFQTTLEVENRGFRVQKTYYHEISIKEVRDGGVYLRLISKGER